MRAFLTILFITVFMVGAATCLAGEKCAKPGATCCPLGKVAAAQTVAQATTTDKAPAADPHAACAEKADTKAAASEAPEAAAAPISAKAEKIPEGSCPDVSGREKLEAFHEMMHPMHMALEESDYATIRNGMPKLQDATKGIAAVNCPDGDKCSAECKKAFETKKADLLKSVDVLGAACKGEDNGKVDQAFETMHAAYVSFASTCTHPHQAETKE